MIHFFGDSFTYGQGCTPEHEYYRRTYDGTQKTWVEMVGNYFDDRFINYAKPGVGNQKIIDSIIENLSNISKGDLIVIGRADDSRFSVPYYRKYDNKTEFSSQMDIIIGVLIDRLGHYKTWPDDYYESILGYIEHVHVPNMNTIVERYDSLFNSFVDYFNKNNNKCIIWNVEDNLLSEDGSSKYPIISDEYPDINDGHWSWNGHNKFFEYMKYNLL